MQGYFCNAYEISKGLDQINTILKDIESLKQPKKGEKRLRKQ